jgi:acyl carrier protein/serine acetyltransferase
MMEQKVKAAFKLSDKRLELLANLLSKEGIDRTTLSPISPRKNQLEFPLSFNQQRLWLLNNLQSGIHYNDHFDLRLTGHLDVAVLKRTIEEILHRHEVMRCAFSEVDSMPVQIVTPQGSVALPSVDLSSIPEPHRMAEATRLAIEEARKPFDLAQGPLWRFALIVIADDDCLLLITAHHIAIDGWSRGVFLREFSAIYASFMEGRRSPLEKLPLQYADYAVWQADWVEGQTVAKQLEYWKHELAEASAFLMLPTDRPRPQVPSFRGTRHWFTLSPASTAALKGLCQRERVSLFMVLLAVLQTLLHCYCVQEDFLIWTPVANRTRKELEALIGYFLNMLALRGRVQENLSFRELLLRARETTLGALANQEVPLEKLIDVLQPKKRTHSQPLFQVLFVLQNVPLPNVEVSGIRVRSFEIDSATANFELTFSFTETTDGISGRIEYATDLFDAECIEALAAYFQALVEAVCVDPGIRIAELPVLPVRQDNIQFLGRMSPISDEAALKPLLPCDTLEQNLVEIWENVLRIHPISLDDNFFDIGGHSLMAVRLFSEIQKQTGCNLSLATLFHAPTIKQLAEIIRKDGSVAHRSSLVPIQPVDTTPPFSNVDDDAAALLESPRLKRKGLLMRASNRVLHQLARLLPGATSVRPFLHRLRGVQIHGNVFIGDEVYLENEYPECIEIHEGVQIGLRSTVIAHTRGPGKIVFEKNAFVGANCIIAASPGKTLTIGEGAVLGIGSCVTSDIRPFTFCSGEKAKPIANVTAPLTNETTYEQFVRGLRVLPNSKR